MDTGGETRGRATPDTCPVQTSSSCLQARHFKEMLSTANHLKQVRKIKIKEDQLVGLRESYDVSICVTNGCRLLTSDPLTDRSVATEGRLCQGMRLLVAIFGRDRVFHVDTNAHGVSVIIKECYP
jgi:hypothetical protein